MNHERRKLLTIGQFAAIHGINKKTLMWYDEIGLFKPALIKENGYRYYTYAQSTTLQTILMLREMNVSIPEIRAFLAHRSAQDLELLLAEKIQQLNDTISQLKSIRKTLVKQRRSVRTLLELDLDEISLVELPAQYFLTVHTSKDTPLEKDIEAVIEKLNACGTHKIFGTVLGSMISTESLYRGDFYEYCALFMSAPPTLSKKRLHLRPAGTYLRAYCKGSWDLLPQKYETLLRYADTHGLKLTGFSYETGINEMMIDSIEEYITQIEIPAMPIA